MSTIQPNQLTAKPAHDARRTLRSLGPQHATAMQLFTVYDRYTAIEPHIDAIKMAHPHLDFGTVIGRAVRRFQDATPVAMQRDELIQGTMRVNAEKEKLRRRLRRDGEVITKQAVVGYVEKMKKEARRAQTQALAAEKAQCGRDCCRSAVGGEGSV